MLRLTLTLCLAATPGLSDVTGPDGKLRDCYCTDQQGSRVELGQVICLQVDGRMFLAQCQMSLNVPMWREVANDCLSSQLHGDDSARSLPGPG